MARGLVVAAPASGSGKTTVAVGLMAALRSRGLDVQPFKVGPDFIDPGLHELATRRPSYNLDAWMVPEAAVVRLFHQKTEGAHCSVVEGAMGLFDSLPGDPLLGSSAQVAALLGLPVLLVVDASSQAGSCAPLLQGFARFHPRVRITLVVFNRVGSNRHRHLLLEAAARVDGVEVAGLIPRDEGLAVPSRHLGLVTAGDLAGAGAWIQRLGRAMEEHLDLDLILDRMEEARRPGSSTHAPEAVARDGGGPVVAVARDRAFCFYYRQNLELLAAAGAEIREFSPLEDGAPPSDAQMIYLGGGYPELHAEALASNASMLEAIREAHRAGVFIYAECGGMLYLAEALRLREGREFPMAGVLPMVCSMERRFQALGYREVELTEELPLGPKGARLRGHEFHYSRIAALRGGVHAPFRVTAPFPGQECHQGIRLGNTVASYCHIHLGSCPGSAAYLVRHIRRS